MTKKSRGFTLIELLVVIAIIGILAAIVLVSLTGARTKARDARIKADISQVRALAELVYNDADVYNYAALCDITDTLNEAAGTYKDELGVIETDVSGQNGGTSPVCFTGDTTTDNYCVSAVLASGGNVCVGATGKTGTVACTDDVTCD